MSGVDGAQFLECYKEKKGKLCSIKHVLLAYGIGDFNVLRQACTSFRNLFFKLVKLDPFRQAITICSICNKVFRTMFPKPDPVQCRVGTEW